MSSITELLANILAAKYGEEVRGSIHDAIELCYTDGKAGANDLQARQLIEAVAAVNEEQQSALQVLESRVEELEQGEGGSSQQSTTIDIPTVLVDGGVVENVQVNNNSTKTQHVTFTTAFTETPKVMVAIGKNVGAVSQYGYLSANILYPTVTTTGFDFFLANRTGSDRSPGVVWYAYQPTTRTIDLDITIPESDGMSESEVRAITGPIETAVNAIKTGYDGTVYQTAAEAVRTQINDLHVLIGDEPGTAIDADSIGYGEGSVEDALDELNGRLQNVNSTMSDIENAVLKVEEIDTELSPIGTVTTGYVYNFKRNEPVESSARAWGKYAVNGKQNLKITGGSAVVVPSFSLCGAYDENNTLLETYGATESTDYTDYDVITPINTAYIIVNGTYRVVAGSRVLRIGAIQHAIIKENDVVNKKFGYTDNGVIVVYDAYIKNSSLEAVASVGNSYIDYALNENEYIEKVRVSGKNGNSDISLFTCAFYDLSDNLISTFGEKNTEYTNVELNVPAGTRRIVVNGFYYNGSTVTPYKKHASLELYKEVDVFEVADSAVPNPWNGKKITLLGTSVAYGAKARTNYISEAAKILGFTVFNTGCPGGSITVTESGGVVYPVGNTGFSSVMSLAEYATAGITVPSDPSDAHYYCSWERIFASGANDTDLFLFATVPNNVTFDLTDWNAFNKDSWTYTSGTFADHRTTYIGGLLFLLDKMYTFNPQARFALVMDTIIGRSDYSITAMQTIAEYYNIPLIDLWGKMQTTPSMLTYLKSDGGTNNHPSTYAHQLMGKILAGELLSVY